MRSIALRHKTGIMKASYFRKDEKCVGKFFGRVEEIPLTIRRLDGRKGSNKCP